MKVTRLYKVVGLILLFCVFGLGDVFAGHLVTSKKAPVRADSLSSSQIITRIQGGVALKIAGEERLYGTGYWKIELPNGGVGYIYKTHVRYKEEAMPGDTESEDGPATGFLQVHMINVGQADAIYIVCPDGKHQMVIDSGELNMGIRYPGSVKEFKNYIRSHQSINDPIELVVSSHPHSDHIAGMDWLLMNYEVDLYLDSGKENDKSATYESLEAMIIENEINRKQLTDIELPEIDFCSRSDVKVTILRPQGFDEEGMHINDYSIVIRMDYRSSSFLFTGDSEEELESKLLTDPSTAPLLDTDWLKVAHHGSETSTTEKFLEAVTPDIAAISSGGETIGTNGSEEDEAEGHLHPRMSTIENLLPYVSERSGIKTTLEAFNSSTKKWEQVTTKAAIYITNNDGDLVFLSDGDLIWKLGDKAN